MCDYDIAIRSSNEFKQDAGLPEAIQVKFNYSRLSAIFFPYSGFTIKASGPTNMRERSWSHWSTNLRWSPL